MTRERARSVLMQIGTSVISLYHISVDHLYKWALERWWVLRVAPRQPEEKNKYHGTIRNMVTAASHIISSSPNIALGYFLFLQEQIKDIIISFCSALEQLWACRRASSCGRSWGRVIAAVELGRCVFHLVSLGTLFKRQAPWGN